MTISILTALISKDGVKHGSIIPLWHNVNVMDGDYWIL